MRQNKDSESFRKFSDGGDILGWHLSPQSLIYITTMSLHGDMHVVLTWKVMSRKWWGWDLEVTLVTPKSHPHHSPMSPHSTSQSNRNCCSEGGGEILVWHFVFSSPFLAPTFRVKTSCISPCSDIGRWWGWDFGVTNVTTKSHPHHLRGITFHTKTSCIYPCSDIAVMGVRCLVCQMSPPIFQNLLELF